MSRKVTVECLVVSQPIGDFYIGAMPWQDVRDISRVDVRHHVEENDEFLGIQRKLSRPRVEAIRNYLKSDDATFPTSVILAVNENCVRIDDTDCEGLKRLTLTEFKGNEELGLEKVEFDEIALIIDGQHRVAGFEGFVREFELTVSLFIGADSSDQANIFSTVNLAQTKVNRSLGFDLFELAKVRSPQKTCHNVAVALDRDKDGPFSKRIKRLGIATDGRKDETLTQATFVDALMPYISQDPGRDRRVFKSGSVPARASDAELRSMPFRNMFLDGEDIGIAKTLRAYFLAVSNRWPDAWQKATPGLILNRTSGFRALMRLLGAAYQNVAEPGAVPTWEDFFPLFDRVRVDYAFFNKNEFLPGGAGELKLYKFLKNAMDL